MQRKRIRKTLIGCLTAGLLLTSLPAAPAALAETSVETKTDGSGVTVQGGYTDQGMPLSGVPAFLTVYGTDGKLYHLDQVQTAADGSYRFDWTMPNHASSGYYNVNVHINGDRESSEFHYTASLASAKIPPVTLNPYRFTGELNSGSRQTVVHNADTGLTSTSRADGVLDVQLNAYKVRNLIYSAQPNTNYLTVSVPERDMNVQVRIPGSVIKDMQSRFGQDAHLLVAAEAGSYDLPLSAIDPSILSGVTNNSGGELTVTIAAQSSSGVQRQVTGLGAKLLVTPVRFGVTAGSGSQGIPLRDYGSSFVRCSINLSGAALNQDSVQSALLQLPGPTGELSAVPSKLYRDSVGHGKLVISRPGNGLYAPAEAKRTFADTNSTVVNTLASKFVIFGKSDTLFDPRGSLTRAEFATLMVRALGLSDKQGTAIFADIQPGSWYSRPVAIGSSLGLINGYSPSQFAPNDKITREQMATLLSRSLQFVEGQKPYVDTTRILGKVSDRDKVSGWAREDLALAVSTGLIKPNIADAVFPQRHATREEAAEMLAQLLKYLDML